MINVAISLRFAGSYGRPRMIESGTGQFHHAEALSKVLRDGEGQFIAASSIPSKGVFNPKEAEAMAIREALSWLKRHNYNFVQVETDALQIIQSLNQIGDASSFDLVLFDVKDLLCSLMHVAISHDSLHLAYICSSTPPPTCPSLYAHATSLLPHAFFPYRPSFSHYLEEGKSTEQEIHGPKEFNRGKKKGIVVERMRATTNFRLAVYQSSFKETEIN
nr:uncharacterized protein LOC109192287 [Ipomoea batatas]